MEINNSRPFLKSLSGLKVCALWLIIFGHYQIITKGINQASRCVELLFVISGFIAIYAYRPRYNSLFQETFYYFRKRLIPILPLYYGTFFFYLAINRPSFRIAATNFFMLQAWSSNSDIFFSLNGPSWYISALLLCFFFVPYLASVLEKITSKRSSLKIILFSGVLIVRFCLEYIFTRVNTNIMSVHTSPIIRLLDFIIGGYCASVFINHRRLTFEESIVKSTLLEMVLLGGVICTDHFVGMRIPRTLYVLVFCIIVYVFAHEKGAISLTLATKPFQLMATIQLSAYLLHSPISTAVSIIQRFLFEMSRIEVVFKLSLLLIICALYNNYVKKKAENISKRLLFL